MKTEIFQRNQKFIMQDVNKLRKNGIKCSVQKIGNEVAIIVETKNVKEIFFKNREFEKFADLFLDQKKYEWHKMKKAIPLLRKSEAVCIFGYPLKIGDETFIKTKIESLQEENHSLKMKIDLLKSEGEKNK